MREDTVFSPQSPLNAPMPRFLFVPISNIVYVSDPFSSYVNLLDIWYWTPLLEKEQQRDLEMIPSN